MADITIYIVDADGALVAQAQGSEAFLLANMKDGHFPVRTPKPSALSYWDFSSEAWVIVPPKPAEYMEFSYKDKQWMDYRSLDEAKDHRWGQAKKWRDNTEFSGFVFRGEHYDSDFRSQLRINTAAALNNSTVWVTSDNKSVTMSAADLKELQQAMSEFIDRVNRSSHAIKSEIFSATSIAAVDSVEFKLVEY